MTLKCASMGGSISIHAPREGCDATTDAQGDFARTFQSTHPVRGATNVLGFFGGDEEFQSTHPVRGAT